MRLRYKVAGKWGMLTFLVLIVYFLIMETVGLVETLELRYVNYFFILGGTWLAVKERNKQMGPNFRYFEGFATGVLTAFSAISAFAVTVVVYLTIINPEFMDVIKATVPLGRYLSPLAIVFLLLAEGFGFGVVSSLIMMQYYKTSSDRLNA